MVPTDVGHEYCSLHKNFIWKIAIKQIFTNTVVYNFITFHKHDESKETNFGSFPSPATCTSPSKVAIVLFLQPAAEQIGRGKYHILLRLLSLTLAVALMK